MSALAGWTGLDDPQECERRVRWALEAQRLYGPGTVEVASAPSAAFGFRPSIHLPFPRLQAPNLYRTETLLFAADARLDNRDEIIAALGIAAECRQRSDGFVLFRAWQKWGPDLVQHIVGDFAIAAYEVDERRLFLLRDPTGQRPLFFSSNAQGIAFSSTPMGLLANRISAGDWNSEQLAARLLDIRTSGTATYYQGIRKVPSGALITIGQGTERVEHYWHPSIEQSSDEGTDWEERFRSHLDTAVAVQSQRASGRLAAHLSSGLDSSAVASTAARLLAPGERLLAFTAAPRDDFDGPVPRGRIADESRLAALTAGMHGMEHVVVRNTGGFLRLLQQSARFYQEPDRNIANIGWGSAILALARERGAGVLLSGEVGNLTLSAGGLSVLSHWIYRRELAEWWRQARSLLRRGQVNWRGIAINSFAPYLPRPLWASLHRIFLGAVSAEECSFLSADARAVGSAADGEHAILANPAETRLQLIRSLDQGLFHHGALAESGIDVRDPTADRRFMEFTLRLPTRLLLDDGVSRPLARRALADRVPDEVLHFGKRGIQAADWSDHLDPDEVDAIIEEVACNATVRGLLDLDRMRKVNASWRHLGLASSLPETVFSHHLLAALSTAVFIVETEREASRLTAYPG